MYLIGIDIGTQSTKSVITDEEGKVISESSKEYAVLTHNLIGQNNGLMYGLML